MHNFNNIEKELLQRFDAEELQAPDANWQVISKALHGQSKKKLVFAATLPKIAASVAIILGSAFVWQYFNTVNKNINNVVAQTQTNNATPSENASNATTSNVTTSNTSANNVSESINTFPGMPKQNSEITNQTVANTKATNDNINSNYKKDAPQNVLVNNKVFNITDNNKEIVQQKFIANETKQNIVVVDKPKPEISNEILINDAVVENKMENNKAKNNIRETPKNLMPIFEKPIIAKNNKLLLEVNTNAYFLDKNNVYSLGVGISKNLNKALSLESDVSYAFSNAANSSVLNGSEILNTSSGTGFTNNINSLSVFDIKSNSQTASPTNFQYIAITPKLACKIKKAKLAIGANLQQSLQKENTIVYSGTSFKKYSNLDIGALVELKYPITKKLSASIAYRNGIAKQNFLKRDYAQFGLHYTIKK